MFSLLPNDNFKILVPSQIPWDESRSRMFEDIKSFLSEVTNFKDPKVALEQYILPDDLVAFIIVFCANDFKNRSVVDLGCGTGRFILPIQKYFSKRAFGIEIDYQLTNSLAKESNRLKIPIDLLVTSVEFLEPFNWGKIFDTTIMNPPFGTKRRKIDFVFLNKALMYSQTLISLHKSNKETRRMIRKIAENYRKDVEILATLEFMLSPSFSFHYKKKHAVRVDLIRFH
ncbi:MAG: METTL5 family protein [Candidatus Hodarchaeales archaeon]